MLITFGALLGATGSAQAANFAVITSPPTMVNVLILICGCICAVFAYQVFGLVRGGYMSRGWLVFVAAFAFLVGAQVVSLLVTFEVVMLPEFVPPILTAVSIGLFLYALFETKRVLS
jgi:hypothetical protein